MVTLFSGWFFRVLKDLQDLEQRDQEKSCISPPKTLWTLSPDRPVHWRTVQNHPGLQDLEQKGKEGYWNPSVILYIGIYSKSSRTTRSRTKRARRRLLKSSKDILNFESWLSGGLLGILKDYKIWNKESKKKVVEVLQRYPGLWVLIVWWTLRNPQGLHDLEQREQEEGCWSPPKISWILSPDCLVDS